MASADEAMGGESSSELLSPDDEGHHQTSEVDDDGEVDEDEDEDDNEDSSSLSSEDSFESDLESESFTDVTPLHSISNSPLPTQPISAVASKIRDSLGHTDEENTEENFSPSSSDEDESKERSDGRSGGRASGEARSSSKGSSRVSTRRATVKRAPNRPTVLQQNGTASVDPVQITGSGGTAEVGHLAEAIQKLGLRNNNSSINNNASTGVRSRRQREQERRLEAENEQLLKRIIAQQSRVAELVSVGPGALARAHHVAPSTINRKRQQKYIHAQNLALHKRIEAARNGSIGGMSAAGGVTALRSGSSRKPPRVPPTGPAQIPPRQRQDSR